MKKCTSFLHVNRIHFQLVLIVTCTFNLALALANCVAKKNSVQLFAWSPSQPFFGDVTQRSLKCEKMAAKETTLCGEKGELENMQPLLFF